MEPLDFLEEKVWSVSEVNLHIGGILRNCPEFQGCRVEGEVSKVSWPTSGHAYFTLKEDKDILSAAMWHSRITDKVRSILKEGQQVEARGTISVYGAKGGYQIIVDSIRPKGQGDIYAQLEALKRKLAAEGLFSEERKRPIPAMPRTIGIASSPNAAGFQDILKTLSSRWPLAEVWLSPCLVQGAQAPASIIAALERLYAAKPDVILLARGGGSVEDLWCFNDEQVVRTVAASPIPLITGVGHEVDFTLVDFVSDFRAVTPTAAAMKATPVMSEVLNGLNALEGRLSRAMENRLRQDEQRLDWLESRLNALSPQVRVLREWEGLKQMQSRLEFAEKNYLLRRRQELDGLEKRLIVLDPTHVMRRGYAFVRREDHVVASASELQRGDRIQIRFRDGQKTAVVEKEIP